MIFQEEDSIGIQQLILDKREKIHQKTSDLMKARWSYEESIKRPYFHVKPLEKVQLQAWRDYLEFEMKQVSLIFFDIFQVSFSFLIFQV